VSKKLSPRLLLMASFVQRGEAVCDVGADHALLPCHLVESGISPRAILTDRNEGPLAAARRAVAADDARYDCRLGDGLAPLAPGEVDVVVIAGMGGETIAGILAADSAKSDSFRRYILQPRTKADRLLAWLEGAGWTVLSIEEAEENGRMCTVIVTAPKS
jgi:tRNA (adenine22-N1)-methyltransferase